MESTLLSTKKLWQARIGVGIGLGYKYYLPCRFLIEVKTAIISNLYTYLSGAADKKLVAYDAQWTSTESRLWWTSNIKIGYVF